MVLEFIAGYDGRVIAVYEAGPTGMMLARQARAAGIDMRVCAPSASAVSGAARSGPPRRSVAGDRRAAWYSKTTRGIYTRLSAARAIIDRGCRAAG